MKRPASIRGRTLPRETGRCALCGEPLGDPREGSIRYLDEAISRRGGFRLVCRDEKACRLRRAETLK